ncbi:hypothetical protein LUX12_13315 [Streptomyces somaliensis]|uniref:hypothetical protein n=1 Tax=Streptomyces somaliensis TaxID=78355 RepID=UPI0020CF09D9|nr:hypothetical protein [Streptomyces somaliensis]MCP9945559.1 hypothetical protein [Streptomyces somaliensis]
MPSAAHPPPPAAARVHVHVEGAVPGRRFPAEVLRHPGDRVPPEPYGRLGDRRIRTGVAVAEARPDRAAKDTAERPGAPAAPRDGDGEGAARRARTGRVRTLFRGGDR